MVGITVARFNTKDCCAPSSATGSGGYRLGGIWPHCSCPFLWGAKTCVRAPHPRTLSNAQSDSRGRNIRVRITRNSPRRYVSTDTFRKPPHPHLRGQLRGAWRRCQGHFPRPCWARAILLLVENGINSPALIWIEFAKARLDVDDAPSRFLC